MALAHSRGQVVWTLWGKCCGLKLSVHSLRTAREEPREVRLFIDFLVFPCSIVILRTKNGGLSPFNIFLLIGLGGGPKTHTGNILTCWAQHNIKDLNIHCGKGSYSWNNTKSSDSPSYKCFHYHQHSLTSGDNSG